MEQPRSVRTTPPVTVPDAPISSPPSSYLPRDRAAHSFSPPLFGARFGSHADNMKDLLTADKAAVLMDRGWVDVPAATSVATTTTLSELLAEKSNL